MTGGLSIVMPAFNEAAVISRTVRECYEKILSRFPRGEIIVVDDHSTDNTLEVLKQLEKDLPCLTIIRNDTNLGHGPSLLRGLHHARYSHIFCMDSDYQHPPEDFWKLFPHANHADVVMGMRANRNDPWHRKALSRIANLAARTLFACRVRDLNIPFKLFRQEALSMIISRIPDDSLIPSILMVAVACRMKLRLKQVPVRHLPRTTGQCSLPGARLIRFSARALGELLLFRIQKWKKLPGCMKSHA